MPEETMGLDEWYVDVTPFSETQVGTTYSSNTITVHSVIISGDADQSIPKGSAFSSIILNDYVTDYEYPDSVLTWTAIGNSELTVNINSGTRIATVINPNVDWTGTENILFIATNPKSDSDTAAVNFEVLNSYAPVLTEIGDQSTDEDNSLTGLAVTFTDPDAGDTHTITVTSDESNVTVANLSGNISGSTYNLVPAANWNGTANITVTVTDNGTGTWSDSETYTLTVNPVNDAPVSIELSNNSIDERVAIGTVVGLFSTSDPDIPDSHTYTFVSDGGDKDKDNSSFIIVDNTIKTNVEIDFEVKSSFTILVQSDDGNGGTFNQDFIITVNDIDETFIKEVKNRYSFKIYPNPADDKLTIEIENPGNEEFLLEIINYAGVVVYSEPFIHGQMINISEFADGIYLVRLTGNDIYIIKKIIIDK